MPVDSFKYLPRLIARYYQATQVNQELPIPFTPLAKPLSQSRFTLVTSGGVYHQGHEPPFDLESERQHPAWGDPTFRVIPFDIPQSEVGASHWHINTAGVLGDINVLLPVNRFQELAQAGVIGGFAQHAYSFMGYQGFPSNLKAWREVYAPQVAEKMRGEGVDCVLLTTA
jgi:D-proline reductase (dithiol) PrdB